MADRLRSRNRNDRNSSDRSSKDSSSRAIHHFSIHAIISLRASYSLSLSLSLDLQPFPRNDIDLVVSPLVRIAAGSSSLYISLLPVTPGRLFRDYETNGTRDSIVELSAVLFTTFALSCVIPAAQTCSNTGFRLHYALYLYTLYSFIPCSCIY